MVLSQALNKYCVYKDTKLKKERERGYYGQYTQDIEAAAKALVVSKLMAIFHARHRKL